MRLRVDVIPGEHLAYPDVVLVVDVIRATTTAAAFLEAGPRPCTGRQAWRAPSPSRTRTWSWPGKRGAEAAPV